MKRNIDMLNGRILPRFISFMIPIVLSGFLQIFFNMADQAVVGAFAGRNALSSVGSTTSLIHLFVNSFIGLSVGAQVCIAQNLGARDYEHASKHAHNAIVASVILGVIVAILGFVFARPLLTLMKTPAEDGILDGAVLYFVIYLAGSPFYLLYNYGAAIIKTQGDTKSPFIYLMIGGIINVILNLFFVVVLGMKAEGVAIATVISNAVSAALTMRHLLKDEGACKIYLKKLRLYKGEFIQIMRTGIPIGLQSASFSFSNLFIQSSINLLGPAAIAGNTAATSVCGFVDVLNDSLAQSSLAFAGQNMGAGKYDRIKKITVLSVVFGFGVSTLVGVLIYIFARPLLSIFVPGDLEAIGYGKARFLYLLLPIATAAIMQVLSSIMRAIGKSVSPMIICVFGVVAFRLLWINFVFPYYLSAECIFVSYPISWVLTDIGLTVMFIPALKNLKKKLNSLQVAD